MTHTFHINDEKNPKAIAFLEYIRTLDFIEFDEEMDYQLSDEQISLVKERREKYSSNHQQSSTWEEVKKKIEKL